MIQKSENLKWLIGPVLFVGSFLYLYWVAGDILRIGGDEGIYLQGGRLVALGQQPYRDFFAITGPLSFWIEGALAFCGGMSLAVMRLPALIDAAFLAWSVYWLTSRSAGRFYSAAVSLAFLAYEVRPSQLNVNHRWDSGALAMGAILFARAAQNGSRRGYWAASGFLIAAAACATPSMLLVLLPLLIWSVRRTLRDALWLLAGAALAGGLATAYLQSGHALLPMIQSMLWTGANYTRPNRMFYGGIPPAGLAGLGWKGMAGYVLSLLPAILPPLAVVGWWFYLRHKQEPATRAEIGPLLIVAAALVLAAWPRWSSDTLLHTLALPWFLCALLFYRIMGAQQRLWFALLLLLASAGSVATKSIAALNYLPRESRVGALRAADDETETLAGMEHWIQPGDSAFSYPYLPSVYYFLNVRNPTRYSFLQPGMMTDEDQQRAIDELAAAPPRWVIYENVPADAILKAWPGSDPARIPMVAISAYLRQHYHPVEKLGGTGGRLVVMEIDPPSLAR